MVSFYEDVETSLQMTRLQEAGPMFALPVNKSYPVLRSVIDRPSKTTDSYSSRILRLWISTISESREKAARRSCQELST